MNPLALLLAKLAAIAAPLVLLAWGLRIYPRAPLVWLGLVPGVLTFGVLIAPVADVVMWAVLGLDGIVGLVMLADLLTLPGRNAFSAERTATRVASLRKPHRVSVTLMNQTRRRHRLRVRDGVPEELHPEPAEFNLRTPPRSRSSLHYVLRPARRGAFVLDRLHLKARSRLGLWQRLLFCPATTTIHVYPDMKQLGQYALLARTNRLSLMGVRRTRRVGHDNEFERLRDYTIDDNYKHIDWRATARRQKLTVKDFQSSQSQRLIFLVDCGRMMTNEAAGLSLLDHALNSMLMLSYVALRQGDQVGLINFSDDIHSYIPPRGGMNQMNRLLHASFDRFPGWSNRVTTRRSAI